MIITIVASLQTGETFQIKVVELEPNLSFLGKNLDEAVLLQRQHDELLVKLQVTISNNLITTLLYTIKIASIKRTETC